MTVRRFLFATAVVLGAGALAGSAGATPPEGDVMTTFAAGQSVFILAGLPHRVANDTGEDAEVVVTYTVPADDVIRGDSPDACQK
jgi:hypothetical protein